MRKELDLAGCLADKFNITVKPEFAKNDIKLCAGRVISDCGQIKQRVREPQEAFFSEKSANAATFSRDRWVQKGPRTLFLPFRQGLVG